MSRSLVMFSPALPVSQPDNAGTRLVRDVLRFLPSDITPLVVVPDGPAVQRAIAQDPVAPYLVLPTPPTPPSTLATRLRALSEDTPRRPREFHWHLEHHDGLRQAVAAADIIDLQWMEQVDLISQIRVINPTARIVTTVHDVLSQRYQRQAVSAGDPLRMLRWRAAEARAKRWERIMMNTSDTVVVLSDKDRELLPPCGAETTILTPPLAGDFQSHPRTPDAETILFVGYLARWENEQGLLWFLDEVLPRIREARPHARMVVAGDGLRKTVVDAARNAEAELLGFVSDLAPLYSTASTVIVPLHLGAGVKFKTVDALAEGVPVVTTPVGAEGIGEHREDGGRGLFQAVTDGPAEFARAVLQVMEDPNTAQRRADAARAWVQQAYGEEQFRESIHRIYGEGH